MAKDNGVLPFAIDGETKVDLFKDHEVRKIFDRGEWLFSVKDVLEALVDTRDGNRYSRDLRAKDKGLEDGWTKITRTLKYDSGAGAGGGAQETTFVNIEGIFRIMQSIPSGKAEAFKKWLAKVGFERIQEMQNPELAMKRAMALYAAKGYPPEWIEARLQNKISRETLETEWSKRGIQKGVEFAVLTDAISAETFGIKTNEHKQIKRLGKAHSLRDNMTPIELTLTTLGEQATTEITKTRNSRGLWENLHAAKAGGSIAKNARIQLESETGRKVVSRQNYLTEQQRKNASLPAPDDAKVKEILKKAHKGDKSSSN